MNYCSSCGKPVEKRIPEGDNRPRYVCGACGVIHYSNPKIVAGTIPVWDHQILLCRRAIEPRRGYWTLPAGFMENAETIPEAAQRETWEEAVAKVTLEGLYTVINLPHIDQVHMFFRATMESPEFAAGEESLETRLFREEDIPWGELAFPTVTRTLEQFFEDRLKSRFPVHVSDIRRPRPE